VATLQDLLVHVDNEDVSGHAIELAALLAGALDASLTALLVAAPLHAGVGLSAETASLALQIEEDQRASLRNTAERLVAHVQQRFGLSIEVRIADGDPALVLQAHSRTRDLVIASQRDPARKGGLSTGQAARLLVGSACPVLTVPHIGWATERPAAATPHVLQRAVVAWADTRESARALRDAIPLLAQASHVELVGFENAAQGDAAARRASLDEAVRYLARHGVAARTTVLSQAQPSIGERMWRGSTPDVTVAQALLSHAADVDADFLVMGGYGHSRVRELVLGGVTRTILESMTVPVLMSH